MIRFKDLFENYKMTPIKNIHSVRERDHGDHQIEKRLGAPPDDWMRSTPEGNLLSVGAEGPSGYHGDRHTKNYKDDSWPKAVSFKGRIYHQGRARDQRDITHVDLIGHIQAKHKLSDAAVDKHIDSGAMKVGAWNREGHEFSDTGHPTGRTHDSHKLMLDFNTDHYFHRGKPE